MSRLAWRRTRPFAVLAFVIAVDVVQIVADIQANTLIYVTLIAIYSVAAYASRKQAVVALLLAYAAIFGALFSPFATIEGGVVEVAAFMAAAAILGDYIRTRRDYLAGVEERAARLERERDTQAQIVAAAERTRIAREMHDVVAHSLSVMVAQADAAAYVFDTKPAQAQQAIGTVAETGRLALAEMHRLLGVLRSTDGDGDLTPQPGVEQLDTLIARTQTAGLPVTLTVQGSPVPLSAGLSLTVYRIVQEALTNTLKHAGPAVTATVQLRYLASDLEIDVTDTGDPARHPRPDATHRERRSRTDRHARANRRLRRRPAGRSSRGQRLAHPRPAAVGGAGVTITVVLVDDQPLLRLGFRMVLDAQADMTVLAEAEDGEDALTVVAEHEPDVVLMDVRMPRLDGVEATRRIVASGSRSRILILTTFDLDEYAFAGLQAGASGFLLKNVPPADLLTAIRAVASGDAVVAPSVTRRLLDAFVDRLPTSTRPTDEILRSTHTTRTRDPHRDRHRRIQRTDRRQARPLRGHRENPRRPDPRQTPTARPGTGRRPRLRNRARPPGQPLTDLERYGVLRSAQLIAGSWLGLARQSPLRLNTEVGVGRACISRGHTCNGGSLDARPHVNVAHARGLHDQRAARHSSLLPRNAGTRRLTSGRRRRTRPGRRNAWWAAAISPSPTSLAFLCSLPV